MGYLGEFRHMLQNELDAEIDTDQDSQVEYIENWYIPWANSLDSAEEDSQQVRNTINTITEMEILHASMKHFIRAGELAGVLKKHYYYGKDLSDAILPEVQYIGLQKSTEMYDRLKDHNTIRLMRSLLGLMDEAGELFQAFYSYIVDGTELGLTNINEEFGNALWYLALGAKYLNHDTFATIMWCNYNKLTTRYPKGKWSQARALNRDLNAEHEALRGGDHGPSNLLG